jgi:uncharacterized Zn-finger protein
MTLKTFLQGSSFQRLVLLAWIGSSAVVIISQKGIDAIVHGTLYGYGLQFSTAWAQPYWNYADALYYTQYFCLSLSMVALFFSFLKKSDGKEQVPKTPVKALEPAHARQETNGRGIVISCSACHKVVSKPLVMLDFSGGKARLVNVCPYCNAILATAEEKKPPETIVDPGEKVTH